MIGDANEFATYLGISPLEDTVTGSARANLSLELAQGFIEFIISYPLELADRSVVLDGTGTSNIFLPNFPVTSITSAQYFDESDQEWKDYTVSKIRCNGQTGEVYCGNDDNITKWPIGFQNIRINYRQGFDFSASPLDSMAASLKFALYEIAGLLFNNSGILSFLSVDDGMNRQRFFNQNVMHMISPEITLILTSAGKRGDAR
jgi:hypothetical protein